MKPQTQLRKTGGINMTKEEYLKQVGKLQHKLNMMKLRAEEYEALANSIPS